MYIFKDRHNRAVIHDAKNSTTDPCSVGISSEVDNIIGN